MAGIDCTPSIRPSGSFNSDRIAAKLQKALNGIGTDHRAIIDVLTSHTNSQRQEIKIKYKAMYGRDLTEDLKRKIGGRFEDTCIALLKTNYEFLAECLHTSIKNEKDVRCIIDIIATNSSWELKRISEIFAEKYTENLEAFICNEITGDLQWILKSIVNTDRDDSANIDREISKNEAKILIESGLKLTKNNENNEFLRMLCTYNYNQLEDIFKSYLRLIGKTIETTIDEVFTDEIQQLFSAIVMSVNSVSTYFALRLSECIHGMRTDDDTLIRILVSRSEIDLGDIKDIYKRKYERKLTDDISEDTSGDYKKLILKIINP